MRHCADTAAFERFWQPHRPRVWRLVARLAGSVDLADDLTQEVSLRAFQGFGTFRNGATGTTWLYRIPVNFLRQDDTFLLAKLYRDGGDKTGMRRTLRQLIADTQADSSLGQLHRQAEYMLGTGQYPTDFGYKGPA